MQPKQGLGPLKPGQKRGAEKWCAGLAALGPVRWLKVYWLWLVPRFIETNEN